MYFRMKGLSITMIDSNAIKTSAMYVGYLVLDCIQKNKNQKVSIYDVTDYLKKKGIHSSRQLVLGLSFLYSVNIIEFEEANLWIKK